MKVDYYMSNGVQAIDVIKEANLNFFDGNIVKYVWRLGKKEDPKVEALKINTYLNERVLNATTKYEFSIPATKAQIETAFEEGTNKRLFLLKFVDFIKEESNITQASLLAELKAILSAGILN